MLASGACGCSLDGTDGSGVAGCRLAFAQRSACKEPEAHVADGDEDLVGVRGRVRVRVTPIFDSSTTRLSAGVTWLG